jgi:hypothetical protein
MVVLKVSFLHPVSQASHASFATWREHQWCPGDENWGRWTGPGNAVEAATAQGEGWAVAASVAAEASRALPLVTPFDD